ncbi:MAG: RNA 2',3'-cyclic phosphodiesterase [Sideroxydans sp.]|nr:RNA 2',3'-cyclic phosphodiesterase [Sideroxydans sp.]
MESTPETTRRLFFALWPDEAEQAALADWQAPLRKCCGGKAMRTDTLHCTLVFLGQVAEQRLEALLLAAQEATFRPFEFELGVAHYWGHNHIVYAAPKDTPPELSELVTSLQDILRAHRFRFEERLYKPHVTLLRHANWTDAALPSMPSVRLRCREFVLVQSLSDAQGARYEVLCRFGGQA